MTDMVKKYADEFKTLEAGQFLTEPDTIQNIRRSAIAHFTELGFPGNRSEEWRNTNLDSLLKTLFKRPSGKLPEISSKTISSFSIEGAHRIVILNGKYIPELSDIDILHTNIEIKSLSEAIKDKNDSLSSYLGNIADYTNHPFVALNTAFMDDGIYFHVPDNQIIKSPIHLFYVSSHTRENTVHHLRNLIVVGVNSQTTLIENYIGLDGKKYFTNAVTEIEVKKNGRLHYLKIQQESKTAHHIATLQIHQNSSSTVSLNFFSTGSLLTRNDITSILDGEGAECEMNGLVLAQNGQHFDNHTTIDHTKPNCNSNELFKGIYTNKSHGVFNGLIIVRKDAQKTDANQTNNNLLLSDTTFVNSNPQLEIYADDVKCTHSSTTGHLEEYALFYLRSRGLDVRTAQALLIHGFADQVLSKISELTIRHYLQLILSKWLSEMKT